MQHIDEKILELYALNAEQVQSQKNEIEKHLQVCAGCASLYDELKEYYSEVEPLLKENLEEKALVISSKLNLPELARNKSIQTYLINILPFPVINFVRYHPIVSSISFSGLVIALMLLILPKFSSKDMNPDYARAKDEYLITYNKKGEKLWEKHIGVGYNLKDMDTLYNSNENYLTTFDVNGDGRKEVFAAFGLLKKVNRENQLTCFNFDGTEKWRFEFHRQIKYGDEIFADKYKLISFIVGDFDKSGEPVIIAIAQHTPYYPTAIIRMDAETGKLLSEYWHAGHIDQNIFHKDFNKDGIDEIFCFGQNNSLNLAPLLILDPRNIQGFSPSTKDFIPESIDIGIEMYYILFSRSDVNILDGRKRNYCTQLEFTSDGYLRVAVSEKRDPQDIMVDYCLYYYFDSKMNCVKIGDDDKLTALHQKLEADGKLTKKLDKQYYEDLRKNVLYWDGEKFVKEPTMNKNYIKQVVSNK